MLVDTEGHLLAIVSLAADIADGDGARSLLGLYHERYPELRQLWGDSHYGGALATDLQSAYNVTVTVVSKAKGQRGFVPLPRRWVVERTFAWLTRCRRLVRDYEREPGYSEAWVYVASIHRLLQHLAPDPTVPVPYLRKTA